MTRHRTLRFTRSPRHSRTHHSHQVRGLVRAGLLEESEASVLIPLPSRASVVVTWLGCFWERVMDKDSPLACSAAFARNADNGRYTTIFGKVTPTLSSCPCVLDTTTDTSSPPKRGTAQVFHALEAIDLCHMHMQTQLPYGYVQLIVVIVQVTCLANSIFCGIHLGTTLRESVEAREGVAVFAPLIIVRLMRIVFVPLLLDGACTAHSTPHVTHRTLVSPCWSTRVGGAAEHGASMHGVGGGADLAPT
jgi:hypothetical protein